MNIDRLNEVEAEMKRLQARIDELKAIAKPSKHNPKQLVSKRYGCSLPRESAAIKRASMDLTRALTRLRKPYDWTPEEEVAKNQGD